MMNDIGTFSFFFFLLTDLSLDIPNQFRQKRSKDQEPGPICTLRGNFPLSKAMTH